jgi:hypothetical protein
MYDFIFVQSILQGGCDNNKAPLASPMFGGNERNDVIRGLAVLFPRTMQGDCLSPDPLFSPPEEENPMTDKALMIFT